MPEAVRGLAVPARRIGLALLLYAYAGRGLSSGARPLSLTENPA